MTSLAVTIAVFGALLAQVSGSCPDGFLRYGSDACYKYFAQVKTWDDAQAHCASLGGFLPEILNSGEDEALKTMMRLHNKTTIWLGGTDKGHQQSWVWGFSGTPVADFSDWAVNQPDNTNGEDCMEFNFENFGGHWNDDECYNKQEFVCQVVDQPSGCEGDFVEYGGFCYAFVDEYKSWDDAQAQCQSLGGFLPEVYSRGENEFLKQIVINHVNETIWLGGNDKDQEQTWVWDHSGALVEEYNDWAVGQPDSTNGENCMEFNFQQFHGHWNDDECNHKQKFICQREASDELIHIGR